jgi:hypothetical protein
MSIVIFYKNKYFDQYEFDKSPIKEYLEFYYFALESYVGKAQLLKVKENKVEAENSWHFPYSDQSYKYYTFSSGLSFTYPFTENRNMLNRFRFSSIYFTEDEKYEKIERNVVTLWDLFADIGGIVEIISIFSIFLVASYSTFNFENSMIQSLYKVEKTYVNDQRKRSASYELEDDNKIFMKL